MGTDRLLARVRSDIAAGDLGLARVRLQSALARDGSPEVRRELVRVCRLSGDRAAAGRYAFLTADLRSEEEAAFAARHGGRATLMLRALGYLPEPHTLAPQVRARLRELERRRADDPPGVGTTAEVDSSVIPFAIAMTGCLLGALVGVTIVVLGCVQAWQLLSSWW